MTGGITGGIKFRRAGPGVWHGAGFVLTRRRRGWHWFAPTRPDLCGDARTLAEAKAACEGVYRAACEALGPSFHSAGGLDWEFRRWPMTGRFARIANQNGVEQNGVE